MLCAAAVVRPVCSEAGGNAATGDPTVLEGALVDVAELVAAVRASGVELVLHQRPDRPPSFSTGCSAGGWPANVEELRALLRDRRREVAAWLAQEDAELVAARVSARSSPHRNRHSALVNS